MSAADAERAAGRLRSEADAWAARCAKAEDERDAAQARVAELERALAPFAEVADAYDPAEDDSFQPWKDAPSVDFIRLTLGQHRAARSALKKSAPVAQAQAAGSLPPFAEKVVSKLRRFEECAEDSGSGGVDIGRHWLDLLTQLGLLNRVQRSPALWEISQQGEDLLEAPVAQAGQVPVIQVCKLGMYRKAYDLPEEKRAYTYAEQPDSLVASKLGHAYVKTSLPYAGDSIDRGLILLRELQAIGFGVFELAAAPAQGGAA